MRTILRNGLGRYEVLKSDEPLRRGERLVRFASERGVLDFLVSVGGPARRDLHRLADDDFAGEFSGVPEGVLPVDLATRITTDRLKIVHVQVPPPRLRSGGAEFEVLDARDRLRRGESWVRVMDDATAIRFARLLTTLPRAEQRRLIPVAAAGGGGSQREQTRSLSRLLLRGQIRIVRLQTLIPASGAAPPPAALGGAIFQVLEDEHMRAAKPDEQGRSGVSKVAAVASQSKQLPDLVLPQELVDGLDDAWNDSFPNGNSQEQGGILVKTFLGKYVWKRAPAGDSGSLRLNLGDRKIGEKLIATVHTHPYDVSEGGYTDASFSGQDLARLVGSKEKITVVRSGDTSFAIGVTKEFKKLTRSRTPKQQAEKMAEIKDTYNTAYGNASGTFQARIDAAVKTVAKKYKLNYYRGTGSTLKPVPL